MATQPDADPPVVEAKVTVVQVIDEPRPAVAGLTEFALVDEPATDKGFLTPSGDRVRARIIVKDAVQPDTPTNTDVEVAPEFVTLSLSLSLLTPAGNVAKDSAGRLLISPAHEITLKAGKMLDASVLSDVLDLEIRKAAFAFRRLVHQQRQIATMLARWTAPPA